MLDFDFKNPPFDHQAKILHESTEDEYTSLFLKPGCVDAETEFLSPCGWIRIDQWAGQKVAQWDSTTNEATFVLPGYVKDPYTGPMLSISGRGGPSQLVCPDHRIPLYNRYKKKVDVVVTAAQLHGMLSGPTKLGRNMPNKMWMKGGTGIDLSDNDLRLQIAIMADGHFNKNVKSGTRVVLRLKRQRKIDRLKSLLGERPDLKINPDSSGYHVFSFTAPLKMKRWPKQWMNATDHQRKIILEELVHWDGSVGIGNRGWTFCSIHEADVDMVQFFAACEGMITKKYFNRDAWYLNVRGKCTESYTVKSNNLEWVGPPADGHRYCFTTETGFWVARRKGHVYPTGNCGKTFIIINQIAYHFIRGNADMLVVVAPNGVHRNWASDEIPAHMPDAVMSQSRILIWHSSKAKTGKAKLERELLLKHKGLSILLVAYEATITPTFKDYMRKVFAQRKVFMTLDESHRIKGRGAKVKLTLVAMGAHAKYRRILTGTPTEVPPDLWSQLKFLKSSFWKEQGFPTSTEFDAHFCIQKVNPFARGPRAKPLTVGYKNLDQLQKIVAKTGYSMTLEDAGIHLPPLTYSKRYYDMFPEQRRIYENLSNEFRHEFNDGLVVDCEAAITRLLRLQQVACGYLGTGPGEPIRRIDENKNPRVELLVDEILPDLAGQVLVWCRFRADLDQICERLGKDSLRYDGSVDNEGRAAAKAAFQAGDVKYLILSSAGAEGLTFTSAKCAIFHSNSYSAIKREQMEGRNYRIGQKDNCSIIDIICEGTVDNDIVTALRTKFDLQSQLTGDKFRKML